MVRIGTIYVVSNPSETALQKFCSENNLVFINEATVLGYGKEAITYTYNGMNRSGWLFQQLLKLSGDTFVTAPHYVIVDSDTLLLQPHYFFDKGRVVFFENREWNQPYFTSFKRLFSENAPHHLSLTSHMMLFTVKRLKEMKQEIEEKHGTSWDQAYIHACDTTSPSGISDYETYGQWLILRHRKETVCKPFYNTSEKRSVFFADPVNVMHRARKHHSLSVHSYNK